MTMIRNTAPVILALLSACLVNGFFFKIKKPSLPSLPSLPHIRIPILQHKPVVKKVEAHAYIGCYNDKLDRAMRGYIKIGDKKMTTEKCIATCNAKGFKYAGTQHADECFCANTYGKHGKAEEKFCSMACTGNHNQRCGGVWKLSVYDVRPTDRCQTVSCTSSWLKYRACPVKGATSKSTVHVIKSNLLSFCIGINYGVKSGAVWVNRGCGGTFQVCTPDVYPELTSKPVIKVIPEGASFRVACNFGRAKQTDVQYAVTWYFGKRKITRQVSGTASSSIVTALDIKGFKLGEALFAEVVSCFKSDCTRTRSKPWKSNTITAAFGTGIPTAITLKEGEIKQIKIKPLFPPGFFCGDYKAGCQIKFDWHFDAQRGLKCAGTSVYQAVFAQQHGTPCGSLVGSLNWHNEVSISIRGTDDGLKDRTQTRILKISAHVIKKTISISSVHVATVRVSVEDVYHLAVCNSVNDPHMETFDKRRYNNYLQGHFILYRHKTLPYEVQVFYRTCNGRAACNCAVAVRSGNDVIVIDSCGPKMTKKHSPVQVKTYLNGLLTPGTEVRRFAGGKEYHIHFPTGTYVIVKVMNYSFGRGTTYLNVWVKASTADFKNTEGLCGSYDMDNKNDFMTRTGKITREENTFSLSWRPTKDEYLYSGYCPKRGETITTVKDTTVYCDCMAGVQSTCSIHRHIFQCRDKRQTPLVIKRQGEDITRHLIAEAKRPIGCGFEEDEKIIFEFDHHFKQTDMKWPTPSGITENEAKKICSKRIETSLAGKVCKNIVKAEVESVLKTCVLDIKWTDNVAWARSALSDMKTYCHLEEASNVDLWKKNKDGDLVEDPDVQGKLCVNDCNDKGVCKDGLCHCQRGYRGEECSIKIGEPPIVFEIKDTALCDRQCHTCQSPVIIGTNFEASLEWWCDVNVLDANGKHSGDGYSIRATILSFEMLMCKLKTSATAEISVRYTGSKKSRALTYRVFDSACHNCTEHGCFPRNDACLINGKCYSAGTTTSERTGGVCLPHKDTGKWTNILSGAKGIVATALRIKNIAKSALRTTIGEFKAFGAPSILDNHGERSIRLNGLKDFLTLHSPKGLHCLLDPEHCSEGFTLRFSANVASLCENMVILSSCGAKLQHSGIAVYYKSGHLVATVKTVGKQWSVASKFSTVGKFVKLGMSWSHTHGLELSVDGSIAGRADFCAGKHTAILPQLLHDLHIGGSLDISSKCPTKLIISGFDFFPLFHSLIDKLRVRIVNGGFSRWGDWSECSQTCGGGTRRRTRTCTNPLPSIGAKDCEGDKVMVEDCNTKKCPVNGAWSKYGKWTVCTKSCGGGTQFRVRACNNPRPANGGAKCTGSNIEKRNCGTEACPVNGRWGDYSRWTACTKSCGGGIQWRRRECNNPRPANGGAKCSGPSTEKRECHTEECRVKGYWGKYGCWSACSKSCGGGTQFKQRVCKNPEPTKGKAYCDGQERKSRVCNTEPCQECKDRPIDVMFLLDRSGSIGKSNFGKQLAFVKKFVDKFTIGRQNVHVGAVTFSTHPRNEFNLNKFWQKTPLLAKIGKILYNGGTTHTDEGLRFLRTRSLTKVAGVRDRAERVCIVLTDGKSNKPASTKAEAALLHKAKCRTIAIGIGGGVNKNELGDMATDARHVFFVKTFNDLGTIEDGVEKILCRATQK